MSTQRTGRRRVLAYRGTVRGLRRWLSMACGLGSLAEWMALLADN